MVGSLAPTNVLDVADYIQQQGELGRQQGTRNHLASLAQQAYTAAPDQRNALIGQAIGADPDAGFALANQLHAQDVTAQSEQESRLKKLRGAAMFGIDALKSGDPARIQGASNALGPYLTQLTGKPFPGLDQSQLPKMYEILAQTGGIPEARGVVINGSLINSATGETMARVPYPLQYQKAPMGQGSAAAAFDPNIGQLRPAVGGTQPASDPMQPFIDQANAAIQMGAPQDQVEAWLQQQAQQIGAQPQVPGQPVQGGNQLQTTQAVVPAQFGVGTPAGPKPQNETWSQPVDEAGPDGKPIRVQYSNTGERRVVEGAAPIPKGSAAKKSDEQIKMSLYTKGLADDAYAYAAAATGKTEEELRAMTPDQVAGLVAQGSRWSSGPVMGRVPGLDLVANADLMAYHNSAAGKMARMNNPTGPVANADFEVASKSIWGPDKPDEVNAQLIRHALQRASSDQQVVPAGGPTADQGGKYRIGQIIEVNGKQYRVTGGDMNDPDVEPL